MTTELRAGRTGEPMGLVPFGEGLIDSGDLDPLYIMLARSGLDDRRLRLWVFAYWLFYHAGVASRVAEADHPWEAIEAWATMPAGPRGTERRHFRGKAAADSVAWLRATHTTPAHFVDELDRVTSWRELTAQVQTWRGFGPWIAFKAADMMERVLRGPIRATVADVELYDAPRDGALLYSSEPVDATMVALELRFSGWLAPPWNDRPIGPQEVETILCKWKSHVHGHYEVGKDIHEIGEHLRRVSSDLGDELARHLPAESYRGGRVGPGAAQSSPPTDATCKGVKDGLTSASIVRRGTPLEVHRCADREVFVKREDLCCPFPGPSFSKIRGVEGHIRNRPEQVIGVLDTLHSKGGWAVAYVCRELGRRCIDYFPVYARDRDASGAVALRQQQAMIHELGGELVMLDAGRSAILYHEAKRLLPPGAYMMPNALKLSESVFETAAEVARTDVRGDHWIVSISSGTLAAGVLRGLADRGKPLPEVWLHLGYSRPIATVRAYLAKYAPIDRWGFRLHVIDEGWAYADAATGVAPFPCNAFYDLKAWRWLERKIDAREIVGDVVFWNIGD